MWGGWWHRGSLTDLPPAFRIPSPAGTGCGRPAEGHRVNVGPPSPTPTKEPLMHPTLTTVLATSRERELRTVVRRPDRLMARVLELEADPPASRRAPRFLHATRS